VINKRDCDNELTISIYFAVFAPLENHRAIKFSRACSLLATMNDARINRSYRPLTNTHSRLSSMRKTCIFAHKDSQRDKSSA